MCFPSCYVHNYCIHTYTYYVTVLPCVLKTKGMTAVTANSSIFIFFFIFTFQENKGNCEWQTHWYLLNRYVLVPLAMDFQIYTIHANACSAHVLADWIESGPTALPNYHWPLNLIEHMCMCALKHSITACFFVSYNLAIGTNLLNLVFYWNLITV